MQEQMPLSEGVSASDDAPVAENPESHDETEAARVDRRALEAQLEALKRKESELRRALAITDHPDLAEAIRVIEGRAYAVTRVEAKIAQGLSKAEERRREALDKKLTTLREKRSDLEAQIVEIEGQLAPLGAARTEAFEAERREAMQALIVALHDHEGALHEAQLDAALLVPELARLMPEVLKLAQGLAKGRVEKRADTTKT